MKRIESPPRARVRARAPARRREHPRPHAMQLAGIALLTGVGLTLLASPGHAAVNPDRAEADARAVIPNNSAFCTHPKKPLSPRARRLCSVADELPECAGFAAACAEPANPEDAPDASGSNNKKSEPGEIRKVIGKLAEVAVWVLLGLALLAIAVAVVQSILRRRRDRALAETGDAVEPVAAPEAAPVAEIPPDDAEVLLRRAADLAAGGRLDGALYTYLHAALRALDLRGAIRIAKHKTHGEYVRGCSDLAAQAPLREIVLEVDQVRFGGRAPTPDAVARAAQRATWLVRAAGVAGAMLVILGVLGCGGDGGSTRGSDPAGDDIFRALLTKQGVVVKDLPSALDSLPIPEVEDIDTTPAVWVDVETIDLEPATEAHLRAWVEAGGVLIVTGDPDLWPIHGGARSARTSTTEIHALVPEDRPLDEADDDAELPFHAGRVVTPAAFTWSDSDAVPLAVTGDGRLYAASLAIGRGSLVALANDDLMVNVGLARAQNPTAITTILSTLGRNEIQIAKSGDGISPPSSPVAGLMRAGLGLPLWHAVLAALVLFAAVGARLARARKTPPPARRAFAEHVRATGAFYAQTGAAGHALAAFARYARDRLRVAGSWGAARTFARRGHAPSAVDPAAVLAQQSGHAYEACAAVWARASEAVVAENQGLAAPARGDELRTLRELSKLLSDATKPR